MPTPSRHARPSSPSHAGEKDGGQYYNAIAFLNAPYQSLRAGWVPWALFALALAVYGLTVQPGAFPGTSAALAAPALGAAPDLSPTHFLWKRLLVLVAGSGPGMVLRANWASAVFGAIAVGLCYSVTLRLLTLAIEPTQIGRLPAARLREGVAYGRNAARLGALSASLALMFALPFWISSTRVSQHPFYVAWLFLSAELMLLFLRRRSWPLAFLWAFVHGAGLTQTPAFIDFLPLLGFLFLYALWGDQEARLGAIVPAAVVGALLGLTLLVVQVSAFQSSPGWALNGSYTSFLNCANRCVKGLFNGTRGGLGKAPWLILLGLTIAPWAAALGSARRAINGERSPSFYFLHAVIAVIAVLVVLDFRASPWRFMGTSKTTVVPYVLVAMTFGYVAAYLYLLPANLLAGAERRSARRFGRAAGQVVAIVFPAIALLSAVRNFPQADNRHSRAVALYADTLLDSLGGRPWIVTGGFFDDVLLLRAKERGIPLHCLNSNTSTLRLERRHLPDIRLRNAASLGLQALVQEWLASFPDAPETLALASFPDLWSLGRYQVLPDRLVFLGVRDEDMASLDVEATVGRHVAFWDAMAAALDDIPGSGPEADEGLPGDAPLRVLRAYRQFLFRPRMSFAGNNLGYALSMLARAPSLPRERADALSRAAYDVYTRVHRLDPGNISALLNWSSKVFEFGDDDTRAEAREELNKLNHAINETVSARALIWSLSRYYGYVEDPGFFAVLGWSWANTGQPNLALQALAAAEQTLPEHSKLRIKSALAQLHIAGAHPEQSESIYREMLLEDPGNREAIMGIVTLSTFRGDTATAREFLKRAETAGVPLATRQIAAAHIYNIEGDDVNARAVLQSVVDADPQNTTAWAMLAALLFEQKNNRDLGDVVRILETRAGQDAFQTLLAKAMLAEIGGEGAVPDAPTDDIQLRNNLARARDLYLRASRLQGQTSNVMLLRRILSLDFRIVDKAGARQHAERLLRLDLQDPTANYIMGSLSIDGGNYAAAEAYLRRAADNEPTIANLNDLADVLYHLEKYDEAEERIQQAFQLADAETSYELWDTRGLLLTQRGDYDGAEEAIQKSLALYGDDIRIHVHLANVYHLSGRQNLAGELLRTIAPSADTLPRVDRKLFEDLHFAVLGIRFSEKDYRK